MIISLPNNYELKIYLNKLETRTGICSNDFETPDKHCLLWDFDNTSLDNIKNCLRDIQHKYRLPDIYIVESSPENYHAYSFTARPFLRTIHILSGTPFIDLTYLKLGIVRGYFTLRISKRHNKNIKFITCLGSKYPNEMNPLDLTTNEYLTANTGVRKNE